MRAAIIRRKDIPFPPPVRSSEDCSCACPGNTGGGGRPPTVICRLLTTRAGRPAVISTSRFRGRLVTAMIAKSALIPELLFGRPYKPQQGCWQGGGRRSLKPFMTPVSSPPGPVPAGAGDRQRHGSHVPVSAGAAAGQAAAAGTTGCRRGAPVRRGLSGRG